MVNADRVMTNPAYADTSDIFSSAHTNARQT